MNYKNFANNILMSFFISVTCICGVMAVLGMAFEPDARFGYQGFLFPLIFGAATTLPSLVNYSKRELSVREAFIRKIFQLILIETIVLLSVYYSGTLTSITLAISLALSVVLIFMAVHFILWINDREEAKTFNKALKKMQNNHNQM